MSVPNRFKNAKPPVSLYDLDAEKFNENFDSITNYNCDLMYTALTNTYHLTLI